MFGDEMNKQAEDEVPGLGTDRAPSLFCYEPGEWKGAAVHLHPFPCMS